MDSMLQNIAYENMLLHLLLVAIAAANVLVAGGAPCNSPRECSYPDGKCVGGSCLCVGNRFCPDCSLSTAWVSKYGAFAGRLCGNTTSFGGGRCIADGECFRGRCVKEGNDFWGKCECEEDFMCPHCLIPILDVLSGRRACDSPVETGGWPCVSKAECGYPTRGSCVTEPGGSLLQKRCRCFNLWTCGDCSRRTAGLLKASCNLCHGNSCSEAQDQGSNPRFYVFGALGLLALLVGAYFVWVTTLADRCRLNRRLQRAKSRTFKRRDSRRKRSKSRTRENDQRPRSSDARRTHSSDAATSKKGEKKERKKRDRSAPPMRTMP